MLSAKQQTLIVSNKIRSVGSQLTYSVKIVNLEMRLQEYLHVHCCDFAPPGRERSEGIRRGLAFVELDYLELKPMSESD